MGYSQRHRRSATAAIVAGLALAACGSTGDATQDAAATERTGDALDRPTVVVTTNILGDVVRQSVGDLVDVEVIMPIGSDPHDFAPSARQAEAMEEADLLVVNGAGFEEGMEDIIANVSDSGTAVFTAADHVELRILDDDEEEGDHDDEDHDDEDHDDEEHDDEEGDEHEHEHGGTDPHLWTDPTRIIDVVTSLGLAVGDMDSVDADQVSTGVDAYLDELAALDTEMDSMLSAIAPERRVLITNHEVFGYFADRFDFEVVGTVIPSLSTGAEPSAAALENLAELIEDENVPAIFAETTSSSQLVDVLADEVDGDLAGQIEVVELFTESLGDEGSGAETYIDMMTADATMIADALGTS